MPVFSPRRASVRIWSTVRRTNASMPPMWMTPSSLVNELVVSCLDDMRMSLCGASGAGRVLPAGAFGVGLGPVPDTPIRRPSFSSASRSSAARHAFDDNASAHARALSRRESRERSLLGLLQRRELRFAGRGLRLGLRDALVLDLAERVLVRDQQHHVVAARGLSVVAVLPRSH